MWFYNIILISVFAFQFFSRKISNVSYYSFGRTEKNKISLIYKNFDLNYTLAVLLIFLVSALRYNVGWDYHAYYETIAYKRITNIVLNNEKLTILLIQFAQKHEFPQIYFIINSFITIFLISKTFKEFSSDKWISLITFITFPLFFLNSLSVVRNFTAISLVFYGFKFLYKHENFKFILSVLIASMFHKSALIALPLLFLSKISISKRVFLLMILLTPTLNIIFTRLIYIILPNYSIYTNITNNTAGTKAIVFVIFVGILTTIFKEKLQKNNMTFNLNYNIFVYGLLIYLAFLNQGTLGHRLSLYGTINMTLLIPDLVQGLNKSYTKIIMIIFYILSILMFLYILKVGAQTYVPYDTFFNKLP